MTAEEEILAMNQRFAERATAIQKSGMPPLEGAMRLEWIRQKKIDYQDFLMLSDAEVVLNDGVLTLTLDLRPEICDAAIRKSPDGISDRGPELETQAAMESIASALPADGDKIKMSQLDAGADLRALIKDSERFHTVVDKIEPIVRSINSPSSRRVRLAHGYLL